MRSFSLAARLLLLALSAPFASARAAGRVETDLSGPGWRLWLDANARWRDDRLYFPTPDVAQLPSHPPTGGWEVLNATTGVPVAVPGTVEEYLQQKPGPDGDLTGVSWWWRTLVIPDGAGPRRVVLRFEAARQRAEVYVNHQLAGYDVVGNSPFEVDLSRFVQPGQACTLAIRITDPAGNFDWRDSQPMHWGEYALPMSHGFGGLPGRIRLIVSNPVAIDDVYVQNTPEPGLARAVVTVRNATNAAVSRALVLRVVERSKAAPVVFETKLPAATFPPGDTAQTVALTVPQAKPWDLDHPTLYLCRVALEDAGSVTDATEQTFGFRWFALDGVGEDAVLRLNGRRIVLRTAISWGFWPINGLFPTPALAEKQVRVAKELGLNMLNFHRAIGNPVVLEKADELGLLYFEEPGAYKSAEGDPFAEQLAREKLLRMVRRDRSHPSLILYNLINEWDSRNPHPNPAEIARHQADMAAAHAVDPSRVILHTSAWARGEDVEDPAKLHFRPYDPKPYLNGWYDVHHAGGPATWNTALYRSPADFYARTENRREVVFWGEEGALSTPPRLALIKRSLDAAPNLGWDGAMYLDWDHAFADFLDRKSLHGAFADVDAFTRAMGNVSLYHQGRRIENVRMSNVADGYAINGWESEIVEDHSGIVDCFRNPKGDPATLAYYNQPLYVAVKVRNPIVQPPGRVVADVFLVNEANLHGPHELELTLRDAAGRALGAPVTQSVNISGGETYGELLAPALTFPVPAGTGGALQVSARLCDSTGAEKATGRDGVVAVDWRADRIAGQGAVWEPEPRLAGYLAREKQLRVPSFSRALPRLDWIAVARGPAEGEPEAIPASRLTLPDGSGPGVRTTIFRDRAAQEPVLQRTDAAVAFSVDDGAAPDPSLAVMTNYPVRWSGRITPPRAGRYTFVVRASGGARLEVAGDTVVNAAPVKGGQTARGTVTLAGTNPVPFTLELRQGRGVAHCDLSWIPPEEDPTLADAILDRVRRDGTTLVILERAEAWMPRLTGAANPGVTYRGEFKVGKTWLGGVHFVRDHPVFAGLPVNTAMDWPYQAVVRNGEERTGLELDGETLIAGCYHSYPMHLGTAVGVIPLGRGRVVFSTLDLCSNLDEPEGPADVARKLVDNLLNFAAAP